MSWLLLIVESILNFFFGLLPSFTLPSWLSSSPIPSGVSNSIGGFMAGLSGFIPVSTILSVLETVLALWPVAAGYIVFQWLWEHIPTIAGFGTGDGG